MSLIRLGVRIAAVQAIKGATFAEGRVYDSAIASIDELVKDTPKPFIIVTTDDDEMDITGRDLLAGDRGLDLVIECVLAGKTDAGVVEIPHTDEGMEITLDLMHRQVMRALTTEENLWSLDFKSLVPTIRKIASRRGASAEHGVRFAARQIVINIDTINDPDYGVALDAAHPLAILAANLTAAGGDLIPVANLITAEASGTLIPDWERVLTDLGMRKTAAEMVRIGDYIEDEAADTLTEVEADSIDLESQTVFDTHIINEANAAEQDPPDA